MYEPGFDIPKPNFATDKAFGEQGEALIKQFLDDIGSGALEVKTDRYRNGKMVVETNQGAGVANSWQRSGLNVTTAKWWVYQYGLDGTFVIVSVSRMRRFFTANRHRFNEDTKIEFGYDSKHKTKGWLIEWHQLLELMTDARYDDK